MKKLLHSILLLLLSTTLLSQNIKISGEVFDMVTGNPLPYSNVMVLYHPIGTTTDKNGRFNLNLVDSLISSSLIISFVGYKSEKVKIDTNVIVKLTPESFIIPEVIVKPVKKKYKPVTLNNFKKSDCFIKYSTAPFIIPKDLLVPYRPAEPTIEAIQFYASDEYVNKRLKEVRLSLRNFGIKESVFGFRILKSNINKAPGEDLVKSPILINYIGGNEMIINLEEYNLFFPTSGIFIGVELLLIPENRYSIYKDLNTAAALYSPYLFSLESDNKGEYWIYSKGKWQESKFWYFKEGIWIETENQNIKDPKASKPILIKPAISLTLD